MKREIPQWVIEYNNANHQSSAGKAIKILMNENERMAELLKEERNKAIDECTDMIQKYFDRADMDTPFLLHDMIKSLKSQ